MAASLSGAAAPAMAPSGRREFVALTTARCATIVATLAATFAPALTNAAVAVVLFAFLLAPSARTRLRLLVRQPLAQATLAFLVILVLSITWSEAPRALAMRDLWGWRTLVWLLVALAIFDDDRWKLRFATMLVAGALIVSALAIPSYFLDQYAEGLRAGTMLRNNATQSLAVSVAAIPALGLALLVPRHRLLLLAAAAVLVVSVAFFSTPRSGLVALVALTTLAAVMLLPSVKVRIAAVGVRIRRGDHRCRYLSGASAAILGGLGQTSWRACTHRRKRLPSVCVGYSGRRR